MQMATPLNPHLAGLLVLFFLFLTQRQLTRISFSQLWPILPQFEGFCIVVVVVRPFLLQKFVYAKQRTLAWCQTLTVNIGMMPKLAVNIGMMPNIGHWHHPKLQMLAKWDSCVWLAKNFQKASSGFAFQMPSWATLGTLHPAFHSAVLLCTNITGWEKTSARKRQAYCVFSGLKCFPVHLYAPCWEVYVN